MICKSELYASNIIKEFEGLKLSPYICPSGYKTIGYGHKIGHDTDISSITIDQAEDYLKEDIARAKTAINRLVNTQLDDAQLAALISFTYNLGAGALQRSTLRQKINYGAPFDEVRSEFARWVYAGGRILKGLVYRRAAEASLFCNGTLET